MKKFLIGLPLILALTATGALAQDRGRGGYGRGGYPHAEGAGPPRGARAFAPPHAAYGGQVFAGPRYGAGADGGRPYPGGYGGGRGYGAPPAAPAYARGGYPAERYAEPAFRGGPSFSAPVRAPPGPSFGRSGGVRGFTRGQVLPQSYWGGEVADPRAYHLRRPPNGYGWVTVGETAYLTQRSTGLILDTAPLY